MSKEVLHKNGFNHFENIILSSNKIRFFFLSLSFLYDSNKDYPNDDEHEVNGHGNYGDNSSESSSSDNDSLNEYYCDRTNRGSMQKF